MRERDLRSVLVLPEVSIAETIRVIDAGAMAIALVIDEIGRLLGTVTDGDVRRGILRGVRFEDRVEKIMHPNPVVAPQGSAREELLRIMRQHDVEHLPIVDAEGRVVGLELLGRLLERAGEKDNWVVVLAGGLGTRLRPLTEQTPKPLLRVGDRTVLDVLVEQIASYGFQNLLLAVGYQADRVEQHFGDGARLGVRIRYVRETEPLGTIGAVRLAEAWLERPFLVVNGDLMTRVNFEHLLEFHERERFDITLALKEYEFRIPYGVVELSSGEVCALEEKPRRTCLVNAGIYALQPSVITLIPAGRRFDMTDLVQSALESKHRVGGFPIHEYWLDIGASEDYERAHQAYLEHFREGREL